jgi:hypothetical protein
MQPCVHMKRCNLNHLLWPSGQQRQEAAAPAPCELVPLKNKFKAHEVKGNEDNVHITSKTSKKRIEREPSSLAFFSAAFCCSSSLRAFSAEKKFKSHINKQIHSYYYEQNAKQKD